MYCHVFFGPQCTCGPCESFCFLGCAFASYSAILRHFVYLFDVDVVFDFDDDVDVDANKPISVQFQ